MAVKQNCIRPVCGKEYDSDEPDRDYCSECRARNKKVAEEINKKILPSIKPQTMLEQYDELREATDGHVNIKHL